MIVCVLLAQLLAVSRVEGASVKRPGFKNGSSDRFSHGFGKRGDSSRDRVYEYRPTLAELLLDERFADSSAEGYSGTTLQDLVEAIQRQRNAAERDYSSDLANYTR